MVCVGGRIGQQEGSGGYGRTSSDYEKGKVGQADPPRFQNTGREGERSPEMQQAVFGQHLTLISLAHCHPFSLYLIKAFIRRVLLGAVVRYFVIFSHFQADLVGGDYCS